jgi:holo-[acyl-carrier protein] synthase
MRQALPGSRHQAQGQPALAQTYHSGYNTAVQHVGIDIVEISRIETAITRTSGFLERVFTPAEIACYGQKTPSLAARFAAKEAVIKALSDPGLNLRDIEVLSAPDGRPLLNLYGQAKEKASCLGIASLEISLSHSQEYAVAFVVGSSRNDEIKLQ